MPWAEDRLGAERIKGAYAWRDLLDSGVLIPGGSDAPVERLDPIGAFIAAVWRTTREGEPPGGWYVGQAMTRAEALKCMTEWAAYGAFQEERLGTLERGMRADMTVLDVDLMEDARERIAAGRVEMTVFDGRVVYVAEAPAAE